MVYRDQRIFPRQPEEVLQPTLRGTPTPMVSTTTHKVKKKTLEMFSQKKWKGKIGNFYSNIFYV
jgi:hypothetical protein